MANRRIKNYLGLKEAICDIFSHDNDIAYDEVMQPPDLFILIDEEEDRALYANKLPRNVPGNIEVVAYRPMVEDVWCSDDNKPLQTIASSNSRKFRKKKKNLSQF